VTFFFSSRRRHTRFSRDWSSDVCSSDLEVPNRYRLNPRPSGRGARQPVVVGSSPTVLNRERSSIGRAPAAGGFSQAYLKKLRELDRKSTRLNSSHVKISYAVFCLKKKKK